MPLEREEEGSKVSVVYFGHFQGFKPGIEGMTSILFPVLYDHDEE